MIDGDLYVYDLARRARRSGSPTRPAKNSRTGSPSSPPRRRWTAPEGYWFAPAGDAIAYQQNDDSALETFYIADPANPSKAPNSWRYPRAGQANSDVRLAIASLSGGETVAVGWDRQAYPYLAAVKWDKDSPLTILVQNRAQSEELLLAVDAEDRRHPPAAARVG